MNIIYCAELTASPSCCTELVGVVDPSTVNCIAKYLTELSVLAYLSIKCIGCDLLLVYVTPLYVLPFPDVEPKLSELTYPSNIDCKSNIPTPALLGVVLKDATSWVATERFIGLVPIWTSATYFTLYLFVASSIMLLLQYVEI